MKADASPSPSPVEGEAAPAPVAAPAPTDAIVDAWISTHICNSPVSRDPTIFAYVRERAEALKLALKE